MHLSHVFEDLEAGTSTSTFAERVDDEFRPGLDVPLGDADRRRRGRASVATIGTGRRATRVTAHRSQRRDPDRLAARAADVVGPDGTRYPQGHGDPAARRLQHARQPVLLERRRERDGWAGAAAGVHFVVFNPTSDDFHRGRLAMDGVLPDGTTLAFTPGPRGQGFNAVLKTTHRQNFLVPPRVHRSFPLSSFGRRHTGLVREGAGLRSGASRSGGTGRRAGLKIRFPAGSVGSIPTFGIAGTCCIGTAGPQGGLNGSPGLPIRDGCERSCSDDRHRPAPPM